MMNYNEQESRNNLEEAKYLIKQVVMFIERGYKNTHCPNKGDLFFAAYQVQQAI